MNFFQLEMANMCCGLRGMHIQTFEAGMAVHAGEGKDQIRPSLANKSAGRRSGDSLDIAWLLHDGGFWILCPLVPVQVLSALSHCHRPSPKDSYSQVTAPWRFVFVRGTA